MEAYIILIFSHFIGDVLFQRNIIIKKLLKGQQLSQLKRQKIRYLALHAALYTIPVCIGTMYLNFFNISSFFIIFISHFFIDYIKCYKIEYKNMTIEFFIINLIDQLLHISILFIIVNLKNMF
jgi:hypothetical protein